MDISSVIKYRKKLIEYGKRVNFRDYLGFETNIYVCDGKKKEDMDEYPM